VSFFSVNKILIVLESLENAEFEMYLLNPQSNTIQYVLIQLNQGSGKPALERKTEQEETWEEIYLFMAVLGV
jgi:hypothetical protein